MNFTILFILNNITELVVIIKERAHVDIVNIGQSNEKLVTQMFHCSTNGNNVLIFEAHFLVTVKLINVIPLNPDTINTKISFFCAERKSIQQSSIHFITISTFSIII